MFLTGLALLPAIALVVWIYRQDKVEKEPRGLLWKIFLFGVLSVIPAMILEIILDEVFLVFVDADTLCYVILDNFIGGGTDRGTLQDESGQMGGMEASGLQL